jgi:hypothetical protein
MGEEEYPFGSYSGGALVRKNYIWKRKIRVNTWRKIGIKE